MNEQDLQYLLKAYQEKSFDFFTQIVALQAKVNKITDVNAELGKQSSRTTRGNQKTRDKIISEKVK